METVLMVSNIIDIHCNGKSHDHAEKLYHDHQIWNHRDHHHDNEGEKTIANLCIKVGRGCGQSDNTLAQMLPTDGGVIMMMITMTMMLMMMDVSKSCKLQISEFTDNSNYL